MSTQLRHLPSRQAKFISNQHRKSSDLPDQSSPFPEVNNNHFCSPLNDSFTASAHGTYSSSFFLHFTAAAILQVSVQRCLSAVLTPSSSPDQRVRQEISLSVCRFSTRLPSFRWDGWDDCLYSRFCFRGRKSSYFHVPSISVHLINRRGWPESNQEQISAHFQLITMLSCISS